MWVVTQEWRINQERPDNKSIINKHFLKNDAQTEHFLIVPFYLTVFSQ